MDLAAPAPAELRDWFRQVEADAAALMKRLGIDPELLARGELPNQSGLECRSRAHLMDALARDDPPFKTLPTELERWISGSRQFEIEFRHGKKWLTAPSDRGPTGLNVVNLTAFVTAQGALRALPEVLGVVIAVCRNGAKQAVASSKGKGNRVDTFSRELFIGLARVHEVLYGCKPRYRDNDREPKGPAILWARHLLRIAIERMPKVHTGDATPLVAALTSDARLSDGRLANLIHEGCREWEQTKRSLLTKPGEAARSARKSKRTRGK